MDNQLGRRLRTLRQRAGLSATALAGDALSVATISRIEHGSIEPSLGTLRYVAARLGCPISDLLTEDDDGETMLLALEEVETWLLLGRPDVALSCAAMALNANAAIMGTPNSGAGLSLLRLQWAILRAQALLDAAKAPALDEPIGEARRGGDAWGLARLVVVRVGTLDSEVALSLLQTALRALPSLGQDSAGHQLCRAELSALLGQYLEASGELETARGLYADAAALGDLFRQPASWAQTFLHVPDPATQPGTGRTPPRPAVETARPRTLSPGFALAAVWAGTRLWRSAMVHLARLDLQARRLADAARRLRTVYTGGTGSAEMAVLSGFWGELEHVTASRQGTDGVSVAGSMRRYVTAATEDELARLEAAAQAGRPGEAERIGALLAMSLSGDAAPLVHSIWLRLATAWADAGNAPRAARALRAARHAGQ